MIDNKMANLIFNQKNSSQLCCGVNEIFIATDLSADRSVAICFLFLDTD